MVLVDTSVWIDFFQLPEGEAATTLAALMAGHNQTVLCGIVLQEILQGIRDAKSHERTRQCLLALPFVETKRATWLLAASLYRDLRALGVTLPSVDVTIAAIAIENNFQLYSRDAHFEAAAIHSTLRLYSPSGLGSG